MEKIRALKADEIEVRVGQVMEKGYSLLLYKDSRCDKRILDETFGINGWANCFSEIKGNLFCSIMILDKETDMWIQKQDCGVESNAEKEKGEASDAFKRACFNLGIGRELYTKIFIFVKGGTRQKVKTINGKKEPVLVNGRPVYELEDPYEKWHVADIETDNEKEKIQYLQIANSKGEIVFTYGKKSVKPKVVETTKKVEEKPEVITTEEQKKLFVLANNQNEVVRNVINRYGYEKTNQIKKIDYEQICTEIESEILL